MRRTEGAIDSGYFIAPALLFSIHVRMGKKLVRFLKTVNLIICNITFTVIFYLRIYESRWERDIT